MSAETERRKPPLPPLVGRTLEPFYRAGVAFRNGRYDAGRGVQRLPLPVVSIGNLSVGGTGKTPMVAWAVRVLAGAGIPAMIAMRGYSPDGRHGPNSDEAREFAKLLPGVPIAAHPNRIAAAQALLQTPAGASARCVVLDDGFQHRRIARELDIVLIDATRSPFIDRLLPAGWLREPVASLRRAGLVVITHAESAPAALVHQLDRRIAEVRSGRGADAVVEHRWGGLRVSEPPYGVDREEPVQWLSARAASIICGIGNPGPFLARARAACARFRELVFEDHATYAPGTVAGSVVRSIGSDAGPGGDDCVLTTEKDWTKLRSVAAAPGGGWSLPVARPILELGFVRGEDAVREALIRAAATVQ